MIDQLPEEIFIYILPCVGGTGFLNLRKTCWRLKTTCDNLEMSKKPLLWWRYVVIDFPQPLLNTFQLDTPKEDEILWKRFYVGLFTARHLKRGASFLDLRLTTETPNYVDGLGFVGEELILTQSVGLIDYHVHYRDQYADCLTFDDADDLQRKEQNAQIRFWYDKDKISKAYNSNKDKIWKWAQYATMRSTVDNFKSRKQLNSMWKDYHINMKSIEMDKGVIEITRLTKGSVMSFPLRNFYDGQQIVFNSDWVVVLCQDKLAIAAIDLTFGIPESVTWIPLNPGAVNKVLLIGNLLLLLNSSGCLQAAKICRSDKNKISLSEFSQVKLDAKTVAGIDLPKEVTDIQLHNNLLFALTAIGDLFICVLESCELEDIEKNWLPPFRINIKDESRTMRMAVKSNQGLKVAVLEQNHDGQNWLSHLHMIYIRPKKKKCPKTSS